MIDGFYFCVECGKQISNLVEMENDEYNEIFNVQQRVRIGTGEKKKQRDNLTGEDLFFIFQQYSSRVFIFQLDGSPAGKNTIIS